MQFQEGSWQSGYTLGRNTPGESVDACYQAVQTLVERFTARFHSTSCLELTGVHLGTAEGQAVFVEKGLINECINYAGETARMVVEIIA